MVAKGSADRRSSSSTGSSTKRRISSTTTSTHEKKKIVKPMGVCSFCLGDEDKNAQGIPEDMISCAECGNCGHPSCLKYSDRLIEKIKTLQWQCLDCKKCIVCHKGDDSLLFCDLCDAAIHPKCCTPPLNHVPKGEFACANCRQDGTVKAAKQKSLKKTASKRSLRSQNSSEEDIPPVITRPVAQLIDGMSNFFLPKKDKMNNIQRQQSIQKAMKYLRNKPSNSKALKRLQTIPLTKKKSQSLARSILASSKIPRIRRKPLNLTDDSPSNSQTNPSTSVRRSGIKKSITSEPETASSRSIRRSGTHASEDSTKANASRLSKKRKHSISPTPSTPVGTKKRTKDASSIKKSPSKRKEAKVEEAESENEDTDDEQKATVSKRKLNLDLSKYTTPPGFLNDSLPDTIVAHDVYLFLDARKNSTKLISDCSEQYRHSTDVVEDDVNNTRWPPYIVFGSELIKTWYSSSYPQEYARVPRLFICEFCLKYMKCEQVYDRHRKKCQTFHPPANEIYHKDDLSVFEVDGNINRIYCQNLCLLAKLFLDHKTLYYDVEPFLFYVLTKNDSNGCHFLGYFSKEKHCPQKYNLSCITVLPHCQRRGYGRFLIELSYLLSQKENQIGTPERPLSTHGAQTYEAYWKVKIVQQLLNYYHKEYTKCTIKNLMNETGMAPDDILDTLQNLGCLTMYSNEKPVIHVDITKMEQIMRTEKSKHAHWVSLDGEFLRFTPVLKPILLINDENSYENQTKMIEVVFRKIESDPSESAGNMTDTADHGNTTETVRIVRRRKFGRKRRSVYVKCRAANKSGTNTENHHTDEHSQEYISRRRDSLVNESTKDATEDDDGDEEKEKEEEEEEKIRSPITPKSPSKQPTFKQLTMDQFLKKLPETSAKTEQPKSEKIFDLSPKTNDNEEAHIDVQTDNNEEFRLPRRTKRLSNTPHVSKSETDLTKMANGATISETLKKSIPYNQDFLLRQISDGTEKSNDSSPAPVNSPLPFKKRAWTSSNVQALIDPPISSSTSTKKNDPPNLSRETSLTTPSSTSDALANPLLTSSSSINSTDEETKIARIESQLKTTVEAVKEVDAIDDQPPSLTSPTSMIVSQSNHYNYSTRSSVARQQQQQLLHQQQQPMALNSFDSSTNMNYNFGQAMYPYPYSSVPPIDMSPYYCSPSGIPMNYMPYYPTSSPPMYPTNQQMCYSPNGINSHPYTGNSTTPTASYNYPTPQSSSNRRR